MAADNGTAALAALGALGGEGAGTGQEGGEGLSVGWDYGSIRVSVRLPHSDHEPS